MKIRKYLSYKDSGVDWLGNVPNEWAVERLRFHMRTNPTKAETKGLDPNTMISFVPMESVGEYGGLCLGQLTSMSEGYNGFTYFRDGDIIVAKITPCFENGKGAIAGGLENGIGFGTTELHVLRPHPEVDNRYLFYVTISHPFRNIGTGYMYGAGGQKRVPEDFIRNLKHPIPSINEQLNIVAFLDRETAGIDALIAKKERQIELLQEKRAALISHVVTKGLDSNVKLKDSGVEWLGEIPEHWAVKRLKFVFKNFDYRRIPLSAEERSYMEKIYPYYGASGIIDSVDKFILDEPLLLVAEDGANLLSRSTPLAFIAEGKYWVNNHAHILKPTAGSLLYWEGVLQTYDYTPLISGAAQPKLTAENLGDISLPVPPEKEQYNIANFIDREVSRIDALTKKVEESIATLQEYRIALISAAVTGKIDVCEEVA